MPSKKKHPYKPREAQSRVGYLIAWTERGCDHGTYNQPLCMRGDSGELFLSVYFCPKCGCSLFLFLSLFLYVIHAK